MPDDADGSATLEPSVGPGPAVPETLVPAAGDTDDTLPLGPDDDNGPEAAATVGPFQVVRPLDQGGLGEVLVAIDTDLGREVALKRIKPGLADDPEHRARFRLESQLTGQLEHPGIVPVYGRGQADDGQPYYTMRLVKGKTLGEAIRGLDALSGDDRRRELRGLVRALIDVCEAVNYAHNRGVVHRDLKPANVVLGEFGETVVLDWGIAKAGGAAAAATDPLMPTEATHVEATLPGEARGTPAYMAPEQAEARPGAVGPSADVYALGANLFAVLTGRPPFQGSMADVLPAVIAGAVPRPGSLRAEVPPALEAICLKAMALRPADRYPDARALADDLELWLVGEPVLAYREPWLVRLRRWAGRRPQRVTAAAMGVLLLLVGLVAAALWVANERQLRLAEAMVLDVQRRRLVGSTTQGWADAAWEVADRAVAFGAAPAVREQAAALLAGPDAREVHRFEGYGGQSIAVDPRGRLIVGGVHKADDKGERLPARRFDFEAKTSEELSMPELDPAILGVIRVAAVDVEGPVGVLADGRPVQLEPETFDRPSLWDLEAGRPLRMFALPTALAESAGRTWARPLAMTPDASAVAAVVQRVGRRPRVVIWDGATGAVRADLAWPADPDDPLVGADLAPTALAIAPDGTIAAAADSRGRVVAWSIATGRDFFIYQGDRTPVLALAFGEDRRRRRPDDPAAARDGRGWLLASGDQGGVAVVHDLADRRTVMVGRDALTNLTAVAFSPDGVSLAATGRGVATLWDVRTGDLLLKVIGSDFGAALAFAPDGRRLFIGGEAGFAPANVVAWDVEPGRGLALFRGLTGHVLKLAFSADGRRLAAMDQTWQVGVWDRATGELLHLIDAPPGVSPDNAGLALAPDGGRLAFATYHVAAIYDFEAGGAATPIPLPPGWNEALAFVGTDRLILARFESRDPLGGPRVARVRDLLAADAPAPLYTLDEPVGLHEVRLDPSGSTLVLIQPAGARRNQIRLYDATTGRPIAEAIPGWPAAFDPSGRFLAYGEVGATSIFDRRRGATVPIDQSFPSGVEPWPAGIGPATLAPGLEGWAALLTRDGGQSHVMQLVARGGPSVAIAIDGTAYTSALIPRFSPDGLAVAWGQNDGGVIVADLAEVRRRMATLGGGGD